VWRASLDNCFLSLLLVGRVIDTHTLAYFQSYSARRADTGSYAHLTCVHLHELPFTCDMYLAFTIRKRVDENAGFGESALARAKFSASASVNTANMRCTCHWSDTSKPHDYRPCTVAHISAFISQHAWRYRA
jgi:hypothetical protein